MTQDRFALKLASAIIASGVCALIGFAQYAHGESRCGLSDAGRFHEAVTRPVEEASPAYFLRISETFIDDCPDRLEIREAHLVAARAALDLGNAERAAAHYDAALKAGARLKPSQRMDQSVTLMVAGKARRAREARNIAVSDWLSGLDATDAARLSAHKFASGTIYSVRYTTPLKRADVTALWLAVPAGDGLPAAILIRSAPQQPPGAPSAPAAPQSRSSWPNSFPAASPHGSAMSPMTSRSTNWSAARWATCWPI